jgi:PhnB protein
MTSIEPQLWTDHPAAAVAFYEAAFGAVVLHRVGDGDDIVVQLAVGDARFWVTAADFERGRLDPARARGATGRTLLVAEDPRALQARAVDAGATELSPVSEEHGWLLGRILDPFGHEWELGRPRSRWPPAPPDGSVTEL